MNWVDIYKDEFILRWKDFTGRTSRRDFWIVQLINFIISFFMAFIETWFFKTSYLVGIFSLLVFTPNCAIFTRRLHDVNRSGWWVIGSMSFIFFAFWINIFLFFASDFIDAKLKLNILDNLFFKEIFPLFAGSSILLGFLIFIIGNIFCIIFALKKGDTGPNQYGNDPVRPYNPIASPSETQKLCDLSKFVIYSRIYCFLYIIISFVLSILLFYKDVKHYNYAKEPKEAPLQHPVDDYAKGQEPILNYNPNTMPAEPHKIAELPSVDFDAFNQYIHQQIAHTRQDDVISKVSIEKKPQPEKDIIFSCIEDNIKIKKYKGNLREYLYKAEGHFMKRNYRHAVYYYSLILDDFNILKIAFIQKGRSNLSLGKIDESISDFKIVCNLGYKNACSAVEELEIVKKASKLTPNKVDKLKTVQKVSCDSYQHYIVNENNIRDYLTFGDRLFDLRNYELAIKYYNEILDDFNIFAIALLQRGRIYLTQERYDEAMSDFQNACGMGFIDSCEAFNYLKLIKDEDKT